jgi:FYVE zinc finger
MQNLDAYVSDIIDVNTTPTALKLLVSSRALVDRFATLIRKSEREVIEYGTNLFWRNDKVLPGDLIQGQSKTAVDMKTAQLCTHHEYLGDCHTHPYLKKMGPAATVGPSSGDYMEWWINYPKSYDLSLHFVLSGSTVFLLLTRDITKLGHPLLGNAQMGVQSDTSVINQPMYDLDTSVAYDNAQKQNKELEFWKTNFPAIPSQFADANIDMNKALATSLSFEYYSGDFSDSGVVLNRLSTNEVYPPETIIGKTLTPAATAKWIADSKVNRCTGCKRSFSLTFRKHHCRNCGQIFCQDCSSDTAPVSNRLSRWGTKIAGVKVARVCDKCYSQCR